MGCQSAFSHTVSISILVLLSTEGLLWSTLRHSYFGYRYPWGTGFILKDDTEHIMTHHLDIFQTTTHACISIKMGQSLLLRISFNIWWFLFLLWVLRLIRILTSLTEKALSLIKTFPRNTHWKKLIGFPIWFFQALSVKRFVFFFRNNNETLVLCPWAS